MGPGLASIPIGTIVALWLVFAPILKPLQPLFSNSNDIQLDFAGTQLISTKANAVLAIFIVRSIWARLSRFIPRLGASRPIEAPGQSLEMPFELTSPDLETFGSLTGRKDLEAMKEQPHLLQLFLSALLAPSIILLLAKRGSGVDALGSVNVRNTFHSPSVPALVIALQKALDKPTRLRIRSSLDLSARRKVKRGWEFDLLSELRDGETTLHSMKFTMLSLAKHRTFDNLHARPAPVSDEKTIAFGRVYISLADVNSWVDLSKDSNPIHTSRLAARLFGLKGRIAHGNLVVAKAVSKVSDTKPEHEIEMEMEFLRPVHVPAVLEVCKSGDRIDLRQGDKPLVAFTCR